MKNILSCDWGTSNFRLRLIRVEDQAIIDEIATDDGISLTYNNWLSSGKNRDVFYSGIIQRNLDSLQSRTGTKLENIPILISGMASSSLGIRELDYAALPFPANGSATGLMEIAIDDFNHKIFLVSGLKSATDVMRGEETQWLGLMKDSQLADESDLLFILPGTHSKHLEINSQEIIGFRTYMTGEFYYLLSTASVLKNSLASGGSFSVPANKAAFLEGVKNAIGSSILHEAFLVRTNDLFQKFSREQNSFYLSGLLIGSELENINDNKNISGCKIVIAAAESLSELYQHALEFLGDGNRLITIAPDLLDKAVIQGQLIIFNQNIL